MMRWCFGALFCCLVALADGAPSSDRIRRLPGLDERIPFKQYSGYLTASPGRYLHYWFVESQGSPREDPVVLWLNGGPGCSSMTGFLEELGPFRISTDGTTIITNYEYSWNRIANVLFIESPPGVGYSYSETRNYTTNDDQTCEDNYQALRHFFRLFPEYRSNEFYLTGESYAGVYIPMLAARVVDDENMNFKGFAVGNGILDAEMDLSSLVYFTYHHGLIGNVMWDKLKRFCCPRQSVYQCNFAAAKEKNPRCAKLVDEAHRIAWDIGLNPYNLYAPCEGGVPNSDGLIEGLSTASHSVYALPVPNQNEKTMAYLSRLQNRVDDISLVTPCTNNSATETYMNQRSVRKAIHVSDDVRRWSSCSVEISATYKKQVFSLKPQFLKVLKKGHRILIYNGDADMACNFLGNEWFVEDLKLEPLSRHDPWFYINEKGERQVAGFYKRYKQLDFVTIKASGHFVPTDKPQQAYKMFAKFLGVYD